MLTLKYMFRLLRFKGGNVKFILQAHNFTYSDLFLKHGGVGEVC